MRVEVILQCALEGLQLRLNNRQLNYILNFLLQLWRLGGDFSLFSLLSPLLQSSIFEILVTNFFHISLALGALNHIRVSVLA